jgi:FKBP-type peptidyl-prolyl cis-trans isomerase
MRLFSYPGAAPISLSLTLTLALVSPIFAEPQPTSVVSGGLQIETTKPAACTRKTHDGDTIYVKYRGTLQSDGSEFDSSEGREPFSFELGAHEVIKGWDKGLLDMCLGEGRRLTIPPEMAYGDRAMGKIPSGSTLGM